MNIVKYSLGKCLRGAIGYRVRLLTERLVVQTHPVTIVVYNCGLQSSRYNYWIVMS